ncbi:DUF3047 domain-containing protein [bacterium]|nr:DUF3047 domain-containing protein [bacterium]
MSKMLLNQTSRVMQWLLIVAPLSSGLLAAGDKEARGPSETIDYYYSEIIKVLNSEGASNGRAKTELAARIIDELFNVNRLGPQVLQNFWSDISEVEKERFIEVFNNSLQKKILAELEDSDGKSELKMTSDHVKENSATLNYSIKTSKKKKRKFLIKMLKTPDGTWKITDLRSGKDSLLRAYYNYCKSTIEKYSFAYMVGELGDTDYIILEDFEGGVSGKLPDHWEWRKGDNDKHKPYEVREENGNKYLAAEDNGESVILAKKIKWNLKEYPYLSFRWRVHKVPPGGDERYGKTVDSAAGVYITYKNKLGLIPVSVKYVWSSTLPVGAATKRSGPGKPWNVVAETGEDHLGEWRTYVFDARQAYRDTFGGNPPDRPLGVGILSDANSTHSQAYADYDDVRALKHADVGSGVEKKLKAE